MNSIVLISGGLDSSLALLRTHKETKGSVLPFFVDYGQYPVKRERQAAKIFEQYLQVTRNRISPLVEGKIHLGDDEPVASAWGRNIALVGLAAMWSYTHGDEFDQIVLGLHEGDVGPDCKPGNFPDLLNSSLQEATKGRISISLPIEHLTIEQIGQGLYTDYGLYFEMFYTCYWDPPCGFKSPKDTYRCPGCRRKRIAMEAAGLEKEELLDFPNGNEEGRSYQSPLASPTGY